MRIRVTRAIVALLSLLAVAPSAKAQDAANVEPHGFSFGMKFGMSDLWGDVGTQTVVDHYTNNKYWDKPQFMGGLFFRYSVHPAFNIRLNFNYGTLFATDEWNTQKAKKASSDQSDYVQRYTRFADIHDNVWEGSLTFEIDPLRLGSYTSKGARRAGQPYLLAGIGYFHFQPYATYTNKETKVSQLVNIYNLHLEGDGWDMPNAPARYSLWQMEIPLGVGYKIDIGEHLNIGLEYEYRMTMTDYLDGVSNTYIDPKYFDMNLTPDKAAIAKDMYDRTWVNGINKNGIPAGTPRGNPSVNDSYSTISLVFFWKFKTREGNWWE